MERHFLVPNEFLFPFKFTSGEHEKPHQSSFIQQANIFVLEDILLVERDMFNAAGSIVKGYTFQKSKTAITGNTRRNKRRNKWTNRGNNRG